MRAALALCLLSVLALSPARAAEAPAPGERLLLLPPTGWSAVPMMHNEKMVVTRLYQPGEDEKTWTEIVTVQIYPRSSQSARQFAESIIQSAREACVAAGPGPVTERPVNGYPMATVPVACSAGKNSGLGGFVLAMAIQGKEALYVVQRQWRGPAIKAGESPAFPPDMLKRWDDFAKTVGLCDTRDTRHPCP